MMKSRQNEGGKPDPYNPPSYDSGRKGGLGNFDDMDDLDFDKGVGDDGWGKGGEDDFGFGSKAPPPQASEPVPAAVEDDEGEAGAGEGSVGVGKAPEEKMPLQKGAVGSLSEAMDEGGAVSQNL